MRGISLFLFFAVFALFVNADEKCGDSLTWILFNGTLTIEGTGAMYDFNATYHAPWYDNVSTIETIEIKEGVTTIGDYGFHFCHEANEVIIPSTITSIGTYAFFDCWNILNITVPHGVVSIGDSAFEECKKISQISLPSTLTQIGERAFWNVYNLVFFEVEEGNAKYASVDGVLVDNQNHYIVKYPPANTSTVYAIPDGVITIGDNAFMSSKNLVEVSMPSTLTTIKKSAFYSCSKLASVAFSSSVTTIGNNAFDYCTSLTSISIPANVNLISDDAFAKTSNLASIQVDASNTKYSSNDGVLFDKKNNILIRYPPKKTNTNYVIPEGTTQIGGNAFLSCIALTDVTIPSTVTSIGYKAFSECKKLTSLVIPASVLTIGNEAFGFCSGLTSVFYEGSHITCSSNAFLYTNNLKNVCISPDYESSTFCDVSGTSTMNCLKFQGLFNHCYRGIVRNGNMTQEKRENATEWEKQTNSCFKYQCNNKIGPQRWSICNYSDNSNRVCVNDQCSEREVFNDVMWSMKIVLHYVEADKLNTKEVASTIAKLAGISESTFTVGSEITDSGTVKTIVIFNNDHNICMKIAKAINDMDKGTNCQYGILCETKEVVTREVLGSVSSGHRILFSMLCLAMMILFSLI